MEERRKKLLAGSAIVGAGYITYGQVKNRMEKVSRTKADVERFQKSHADSEARNAVRKGETAYLDSDSTAREKAIATHAAETLKNTDYAHKLNPPPEERYPSYESRIMSRAGALLEFWGKMATVGTLAGIGYGGHLLKRHYDDEDERENTVKSALAGKMTRSLADRDALDSEYRDAQARHQAVAKTHAETEQAHLDSGEKARSAAAKYLERTKK